LYQTTKHDFEILGENYPVAHPWLRAFCEGRLVLIELETEIKKYSNKINNAFHFVELQDLRAGLLPILHRRVRRHFISAKFRPPGPSPGVRSRGAKKHKGGTFKK